MGFCPLFMLWDFVLWDFISWDFVRRDFVLWDLVLWDSVPDSSGRPIMLEITDLYITGLETWPLF